MIFPYLWLLLFFGGDYSAKEIYSEMSKCYVEIEMTTNEVDRKRYQRAKEREVLYNENWKKIKVNINEIVDKFTPDAKGKKKGEKFVFKIGIIS